MAHYDNSALFNCEPKLLCPLHIWMLWDIWALCSCSPDFSRRWLNLKFHFISLKLHLLNQKRLGYVQLCCQPNQTKLWETGQEMGMPPSENTMGPVMHRACWLQLMWAVLKLACNLCAFVSQRLMFLPVWLLVAIHHQPLIGTLTSFFFMCIFCLFFIIERHMVWERDDSFVIKWKLGQCFTM